MIALCVVIHGIGLFSLQRIMSRERMSARFETLEPLSVTGAIFTLLTVFSIIFIHFVEIWLFAFLYDYLGALSSFSESLYFSTISYATIGYSDASIHEKWRMIAALEGILGVILLGWSTAFFVRVLGKLEGDDKK
ncbi:potassium channel family protein [Qipengyuania marisflavi]|uniref:Two pore domain potassium channel family protein n=1 Tax=Qipengyuania marisflavi TaxID=2486356 RepID=A0A5S3P1C9_9SPHN|nr:potassium channel family protein [Qipengyuania marisflavi]TMM46710.1 two pore domain potassium channel family protein [Qipengyuania marisflavi]